MLTSAFAARARRRNRIIPLTFLFWLVSRLPLTWAHAIGAQLGTMIARLPGRYGKRLRSNFLQAYPDVGPPQFREAARAAGRMMMEIPYFWMRRDPLAGVCVEPSDFHLGTDAVLAGGKGMILLSPHLGGFELLGPLFAKRGRSTVLFKPPKRPGMGAWVERMRAGPGLAMAPANTRGVRMLLKALKRGETIGILPDQCPPAGEGEWAPFFGRPAYTMTLVQRLQSLTDAPIVLVFAERLNQGARFHVHSRVLPEPLPEDAVQAVAQLNRHMEDMVRVAPTQYLWGYNRYKRPAEAAAHLAEQPAGHS